MNSPGLLEARRISAGYRASRPVLRDVSLQVNPGDFTGLLGPNGGGKTTLLHCLTAYLPVSSGQVFIGRKPAEKLSRRAIAQRIAFVPQQTECVYSYSALEMVLMGRHAYAGYASLDTEQDRTLAMDALRQLRVEHLAQRPFQELSGGERQLVLLARSFAQQAHCVVLDEPLTGLDLHHQFELMSALADVASTGRAGVLATFHDVEVASRWCNRIVLLHEGTVLAQGAPREVLTADNLEVMFGVRAEVAPASSGNGVTVSVFETVKPTG